VKPNRIVKPFRFTDGRSFRWKDIDPGDTGGIHSKSQAQELLKRGIEQLRALQEKLYAQSTWSLLVILQAMDAAGKDSAIKHVMSGVNPQGCEVTSFKAPTDEELAHDFLWRATRRLPERGQIGIFNRSYYEEVLVVRVHAELLAAERLPKELVTRHIWSQRFEDINAFERHLHRNGTLIRKFFLHVSKEEQRKRFLERLDRPRKHWKFSMRDVEEREHWDHYMSAYQDMVRHTATADAPWCVVPADHKWFTRLVIAEELGDALKELDLAFPTLDRSRRKELARARAMLKREEH
jgi:PPK2 family polyphosphate:nucleotide phosphotransferase